MNRECEEIRACGMCNNARIDDSLTDDNDASFIGIGKCAKGYRIMLCSGWRQPLRIEFEEWHDRTGWSVIGKYFPKYCPECGRRIFEYEQEKQQ